MGGEEKASLLYQIYVVHLFMECPLGSSNTGSQVKGEESVDISSPYYPRKRRMVPLWKPIAAILLTIFSYPAILLVSFVIQQVNVILPPGIEQPLMLSLWNTLYISLYLLGLVLEKLGLYTLPQVIRFFLSGIPALRDPSLVIRNEKFDGVPVRIYQSKAAAPTKRKAVLFMYGGNGFFGNFGLYERILRYFAKEGDSVVVAVEYRLGPENPYPNQITECLKATIYLMKYAEDYGVDSSRIIIAGESAGGNFAARICQLLVDQRDLPKVYAQVLIYPVLQGMDLSLPSYQQNSHIPILPQKLVVYSFCRFLNKSTSIINDVLDGCHVPEAMRLKYQKWVSGDLIPKQFKVRGYKPKDPAMYKFKPQLYEEVKEVLTETMSPLLAENAVLCKLPQTFLVTCEFDVLRDDGLLYMRRLKDNHVPVTWSHVENGFHAAVLWFHLGILSFPSSERIVHDVTSFIRHL